MKPKQKVPTDELLDDSLDYLTTSYQSVARVQHQIIIEMVSLGVVEPQRQSSYE